MIRAKFNVFAVRAEEQSGRPEGEMSRWCDEGVFPTARMTPDGNCA
jgi:hypothetical protein